MREVMFKPRKRTWSSYTMAVSLPQRNIKRRPHHQTRQNERPKSARRRRICRQLDSRRNRKPGNSKNAPQIHHILRRMSRNMEKPTTNSITLEMERIDKYRPRTKHLNIKLHHFRSYINKKRIKILKIASIDQPADIITKPLPEELFVKLRKQIMGW